MKKPAADSLPGTPSASPSVPPSPAPAAAAAAETPPPQPAEPAVPQAASPPTIAGNSAPSAVLQPGTTPRDKVGWGMLEWLAIAVLMLLVAIITRKYMKEWDPGCRIDFTSSPDC